MTGGRILVFCCGTVLRSHSQAGVITGTASPVTVTYLPRSQHEAVREAPINSGKPLNETDNTQHASTSAAALIMIIWLQKHTSKPQA